jgi:hypothetical protein
MNQFIALILGFFLAAGSASVFAKGKKDGDFDIEIIHIPPNKPQEPAQEEDEEQKPPFFLFVTANGLKGHLNHGDCIVPVDDDEAQNTFIQEAIADAGFFKYGGIFCSTDGGKNSPDQNHWLSISRKLAIIIPA